MTLTGDDDGVLDVWAFVGTAFDSRCRPRVVQASNAREYVAKTDLILDDGRRAPIVAQEWLAACLARTVGLPIPPFRLLRHEGELWFGSENLRVAIHRFRSDTLLRVANPKAIYLIAAFDVWIHNQDRHADNLLTVHEGHDLRLVAIDHGHCPLFPANPISELSTFIDVEAAHCVHECYRRCLTNPQLLRQAIERIRSVTDTSIAEIAARLPGVSWDDSDYASLRHFLVHRRDTIAELFNRSRSYVPALEERLL